MKTQEQKSQELKNYITKSSEHLFVVNEKQIMKIIPFTIDGVDYVYQAYFADNYVSIKTRKIQYDKQYHKLDLFPVYVKTKSIPYFKRMREIVKVIEAYENKLDVKSLEAELKPLLTDLMLVTN